MLFDVLNCCCSGPTVIIFWWLARLIVELDLDAFDQVRRNSYFLIDIVSILFAVP